MDMEDLLCPQVCMDVDDTPLELNTIKFGDDKHNDDTGEDTNENEIPADVKIKILMENDNFDSAQIPQELTDEEMGLRNRLFSTGPAVQFMKLHCTSCNTHLGSSPMNQFNRFIHPLLQVLQCKDCYDFYSSGEFDKDEDGSELYCRWCGQGGKVMCCSDCCFVFCQKCVRQNLGKKALDAIKNSDDWRCLVCNPQQVMNPKLVCYSLYTYVKGEIQNARLSDNPEILKVDHSMCCTNKAAKPPMKRKRSASEDSPYDPSADLQQIQLKKQKSNSNSVLKKVLTSFNNTDPNTSTPWNSERPVICPPELPPGLKANPQNKFLKLKLIGNNPVRFPVAPRMPTLAPKPPILLCTTTNKPITPNVVQNRGSPAVPTRGSQNFIPLNNPFIKIVPGNQGIPALSPISSQSFQRNFNKQQPIVNSIPAKLTPGMKHQWFEHALSITSNITGNLNRNLATFTIEQRNATTIEQLANIHNKLQELLSSSVNALIGVRKNLRNEFLNDLNKLKLPKKAILTHHNPVDANPIMNNLLNEPKDSSKDDDVIIINNDEEDPLAMKEVESVNTVQRDEINTDKPRQFLKVRPVSSLIDSSRLPPFQQKMNGVTENIDLCDDEDDVSIIEPQVLIETEDEPVALLEPEVIIETEEERKTTEPENGLPEVDSETYRQIQRALAESKLESILQENAKVPVSDKSITPRELKRFYSARVVVAPNYKPKKKQVERRESKVEEIIPQDFEEMLSGSIVLNTTKQKFDNAFSSFVSKNVSDEGDDDRLSNKSSDEVMFIENGEKESRLQDDVVAINPDGPNNDRTEVSSDIIDEKEINGENESEEVNLENKNISNELSASGDKEEESNDVPKETEKSEEPMETDKLDESFERDKLESGEEVGNREGASVEEISSNDNIPQDSPNENCDVDEDDQAQVELDSRKNADVSSSDIVTTPDSIQTDVSSSDTVATSDSGIEVDGK